MKRDGEHSNDRKRQRTDIFNPLTGSKDFFPNLEDGRVPGEERVVDEPVEKGTGKIFRRRRDDKGKPHS